MHVGALYLWQGFPLEADWATCEMNKPDNSGSALEDAGVYLYRRELYTCIICYLLEPKYEE